MNKDRTPYRRTWRFKLRRFLAWTRARVACGLRAVIGLLLIIGGIFGFLPILGLWMLPLGIAVAALDVRPIMRRLRRNRSNGSG